MEDDYDGFEDTDRHNRLIEWNVETLADLLRRIIAHRQTNNVRASHSKDDFSVKSKEGQNALDEITEIISLGGSTAEPDLGASSYWDIDPGTVVLPREVEEQLRVCENGQAEIFEMYVFLCFCFS